MRKNVRGMIYSKEKNGGKYYYVIYKNIEIDITDDVLNIISNTNSKKTLEIIKILNSAPTWMDGQSG